MKLDALAKARDEQGFALDAADRRTAMAKRSRFAPLRTSCTARANSSASQGSRPAPHAGAQRCSRRRSRRRVRSGTMSWTVDIANANTGDDFVLGVKNCICPTAAPPLLDLARRRISEGA
jgi:ribonucleoside-diphosphate reductase alpha chain